VRTADGVRIRLGYWPKGDRGTVLMFPGRTEYVEKYLHVAVAAVARGYGTLIIDWRGQGLADRPLPDRMKGHVGHFREYQTDVAAAFAFLREKGAPEPWVLIAHSMGGCIGLRTLMGPTPVRAVAFSGPMWGIHVAPALLPVLKVVRRAARVTKQSLRYAPTTGPETYVVAAPFEGNTLTGDREMWGLMRRQALAHPDLVLGGPTIHWLDVAEEEMAALRALPSPALPCFTAMGSREAVVTQEGIRERMDRWPGASFEVVEGGQHEIVMETPPRREAFFARAFDLFDAQPR
jgi:lysophospholipase